MEQSCIAYALVGSLSLIAAYSILFFVEYRDRLFLLLGLITLVPIFNIILRSESVISGLPFSLEPLRWFLIIVGWCLGIGYARAELKLKKDAPKSAALFSRVIILNMMIAISCFIFPMLLRYGLPMVVIALSSTICLYVFYQPNRRHTQFRVYAVYALVSFAAATFIEWTDAYTSYKINSHLWLHMLLVVSGIFSITIAKIKFSNRLAQTREETRVSVEQNQKMAALGEVSSSIAHEIKNPLAALIYAVDIQKTCLDKNPIDYEQLLKLNRNMEATALQIDKIVNSLRDISRPPTADPIEAVPLHRVIDLAVDLFKSRLRDSKITLHVPKVIDASFLECRETQLCQLILNLLNNAFDAVESTPNAWIKIETSESIDAVSIAVIDSGKGIDPQFRDEILMGHFTTKIKGKGSGLGLSICRSIVHQHHGKIALVEDTLNTRFEVWLPKFHSTGLTP